MEWSGRTGRDETDAVRVNTRGHARVYVWYTGHLCAHGTLDGLYAHTTTDQRATDRQYQWVNVMDGCVGQHRTADEQVRVVNG
mmetsp:Transcript_6509/g.15746  ORF Transcript_6509/g.15746 Transcript_6509/m.15746 type:complete len:83 (-) Transcript_6509:155-403(-)